MNSPTEQSPNRTQLAKAIAAHEQACAVLEESHERLQTMRGIAKLVASAEQDIAAHNERHAEALAAWSMHGSDEPMPEPSPELGEAYRRLAHAKAKNDGAQIAASNLEDEQTALSNAVSATDARVNQCAVEVMAEEGVAFAMRSHEMLIEARRLNHIAEGLATTASHIANKVGNGPLPRAQEAHGTALRAFAPVWERARANIPGDTATQPEAAKYWLLLFDDLHTNANARFALPGYDVPGHPEPPTKKQVAQAA